MAETREGLWMLAKELDRLKVLHEVRKRHITQLTQGGSTSLGSGLVSAAGAEDQAVKL